MWKLRAAICAALLLLACGGDEKKAPEETGSPAPAPATATTGKIACGSDAGVWVINADGTDLTQISKGANGPPSWSPDGKHVALAEFSSGDRLVVVNADGSGRRELLTTAPDGIADAHWSPDGSRIAFSRFNDSGSPAIHVINVDGTDEKKVADGLFAAWLPDGTAILYTPQGYFQDQPLPLRAAKVTGDQEPQKLIDIPARWEFALSPDGTQIAYIASVGEMRTLPGGGVADPLKGLFLLDTDGQGQPREVLPPGLLDPHPLSFSPDGSRLALVEFEESAPSDVTRFLAVVNTDGSGKLRLTSDIPYAFYFASWSPDGSRILYGYDSEEGLLAVDPDGPENQSPEPFANCPGNPVWQPIAVE